MSATSGQRRGGVLYPAEWEHYADLVELAARMLAMAPEEAARLNAIVADAIQIEGDQGASAAIAFLEKRRRAWLAEKGMGCA